MSLLHIAGGATEDKLDASDVFSTYLYTGNGSTQTINNGIDLAGKGGLVWLKRRDSAANNYVQDNSSFGTGQALITNSTSALVGLGSVVANSNGFSLSNGNANASGGTYASWTFRKAPKFFDVVTYTGNGTTQNIAHSLGLIPGMIIVKQTDGPGGWSIWHRGLTFGMWAYLNTTQAAQGPAVTLFGNNVVNVDPTLSGFTVGSATNCNALNGSYIAYLFAHDTSADGIIQCGSFTGAGSWQDITLNWEAQFLLVKKSSGAGSWAIIDVMRGMVDAGDEGLYPNTSGAESSWADGTALPTATGFKIFATETYIYLAIRRPNKVPTSGSEVYNAIARTGTGAIATVNGVGFAPDFLVIGSRNAANGTYAWSRIQGSSSHLKPAYTDQETGESNTITAMGNNSITLGVDSTLACCNFSGRTYINHFFKRAKGFFDNFCWTGTGANRTIAHNLGAVPDLLILKSRSAAGDWQVWFSGLASNEKLVLNSTAAKVTDATLLNSTLPTSTLISLGTQAAVNTNLATYVGYAFASLAGVQKIGTYVGNGTTQNLSFGFSGGARFFLCKAVTTTGSYWIFDSVRGIVASTDFGLQLNSTAAEVTSADCVDPFVGGISVVEEATCHLNTTGVTYMYWAIA